MDVSNIPVSPASEAPPEVVNAFLKFIQENPGMFVGKQVELNNLKPAAKHMYFRCAHCEAPVLSGLEECPSCKKSTHQTHKPGDVLLERYRIEELMMKSGGFGNLFAVVDLKDNMRPLAMKQLQHRRQVSPKDREMFEREGRLLESFSHHAIPRFQDAFTLDGALYLVTERVPGVTLGNYMRAKGAFNEAQLLALLPQMLEVLSYLHHLPTPVVHRDIKPGNFMFTEEGRLYLIDFGAATDVVASERTLDPTGLPEDMTWVFTKGFASPEAFLGLSDLPASDLFSLGATLLFLLSAKHPLTHYDGLTGTYRIESLPITDGLKTVLGKLLALRVQDRYQDAEQVLDDLVAYGYIRPNA